MENTTQTPAPQSSGGGWKIMGILSIVFGGLSILFSFIPCIGALAIYSGAGATVIAIVALIMANSAKASKTMAIIGLVISLASIGIGYYWTHVLHAVKDSVEHGAIHDSLQKGFKELDKAMNQVSDSMKKMNPTDTTKH